jgi:hypothetical protein
MRADADVSIEHFRLSDVFDQVAITGRVDASKKRQLFQVEEYLTFLVYIWVIMNATSEYA